MIKSELISKLASHMTHIPEKNVSDAVNLVLDNMSGSLSNKQRIEIRGFGSFSLHYKPPRNAHNPKTGQKVVTQAKYSPHFKPGKELRERVDNSKERVAIQDTDGDEFM
jgi:integration host factor subunit beta